MTCLLHPQTQAAGTCEYCAQPHCAACLRVLLGRRYCPACYAQVHSLATGTSAARRPSNGVPAERYVTGDTGLPDQRPRPARPPLPGWASGLAYLLGFVALEYLSGIGLQALLLVAHAMKGAPVPGHGRAGGLLDASGIGLPEWSALMAFGGWITCAAVVIYTALAAGVLEKKGLGAMGLRWNARSGRDIILGLALSVVLFVSVVGTGLEAGWYTIDAVSGAWAGCPILVTGMVILLPFAAVEEISLRGYFLTSTSRSWGRGGALVGSSLAFVVLHGLNEHFSEQPGVWLGLLLAGLYLGSAYLITGRLWLPILLHAGWNLMEGPVFGLPVSGLSLPAAILRTQSVGPVLWTGGRFGPEAGLLLSLMLVVHLGVIWALRPLLAPRPSARRSSEDERRQRLPLQPAGVPTDK